MLQCSSICRVKSYLSSQLEATFDTDYKPLHKFIGQMCISHHNFAVFSCSQVPHNARIDSYQAARLQISKIWKQHCKKAPHLLRIGIGSLCYMYMLFAKFESGQSEDCPVQTSDPSFVRTIRRLAIYMYSPTHYFLSGMYMYMLIEPWCIVAIERWTKIPFLLMKKDGSKF